jgi:hypothetical protein
MRHRSRIVGAMLAASMALAIGPVRMARAQASSGSEKVTAEALFEEGRKLVGEGKYADACPKFAASQKLDPSPGTLLNLASCWEKLGHTATAWAAYREAASAADAAGRKDYLAAAQRHADALSPKLARLTVNVEQPIDGLEIMRDGAVVDHAEWGVPIPIDAGSHTIEARAPGHRAWASAVSVTQDGAQASLTIPPLEPAPPQGGPAALTPSPPAPPATSVAPAREPGPPEGGGGSSGGTQRAVALVVAGLGVAGVAVGTVFVLSAKSRYNDSLNHCEAANPDLCDPQGITQRNDARSAGNIATAALGVGAAALIGGGILWLTAPSGASGHGGGGARWAVAATLSGAVVKGAW